VNGSPSQTATIDRLGSRSQLAQLALAATVIVVLALFTGPLRYLPRCVLAAVVFTIAIGMLDIGNLRAIRRESPGEFYLAVATAVTVVVVGVEQGILLAVALSMCRHVRHSYRPHTMVLVPDAAGRWKITPAKPGTMTGRHLIVYRFGADLFYANANRFCGEVRALVDQAPEPVRAFVVDCTAITDMDFSAAQAIRDLVSELQSRRVVVIFGRVNAYLRADMDRHRITPVIGESQIYDTLHESLAHAHRSTTR
ncbi:MAG: STAS domain-containing protein, partial [Pseudomonadota bacterium]|nr:STAS domain-containing protein [Pseudomonadota bacterium]